VRFVIYGAGAIGGTIGGRLALGGHEVVLICRGEHLRVINERGLRLRAPEGEFQVRLPAVERPAEVDWRPGDVVILAMKTQDTEPAIRELALAAGTGVPVFCAQNGVENERLAARRFENVYAMLVALPATFLVPGEVIASAAPLSGCLHNGRYPGGVDDVSREVSRALSGSHFHCEPSADVMSLKYRKLLLNLGNGVEVITGRSAWRAPGDIGAFVSAAHEDAVAVYQPAGITATPAEQYNERVIAHYRAQEVGGEARAASSTLQSVIKGSRVVEVDYLNGEIALLGRLHGVPTPYNATITEVANRMAANGASPGSVTLETLQEMVRRAR
jgi:2-dehydropantoate 2-reductase